MKTLLIITLFVGVPIYAWFWHDRSARMDKKESNNPERELLWAGYLKRQQKTQKSPQKV
ncbi:MAG TPA: hypothetical protein VME24_13505 [Alphaproteobacteria bacterium]|nr:hypothetical protein [Alphaproteobacteria bacterium]